MLTESEPENSQAKTDTERTRLTGDITALGLTGLAFLESNVIKTGNFF